MSKYPNRYKLHSYADVKNFIETQSDCKLLSTTYNGCDEKMLFKCYCGNEFKTTYSKFKGRNQRQCKECGEKERIAKLTKTNEEFQKEIYELVGNEYQFLESYIGSDVKLLCKHNECGYIWKIRPSHFISGRRCPKCAGCKLKTNEEFQEEVYSLVCDEYIFQEPYVNSVTKLQCLHTVCGNTWNVTPHNFLNVGTRCPFCGSSQGEQKIIRYLEHNTDILFEREYVFDNLLGVSGKQLRFDFAVFDKNMTLIFLIEYDGEQHCRPVDFKGRGKKWAEKEFKTLKIHDKYKNDYCIRNSIPLLRIPYTKFDDVEVILNKQFNTLKKQHEKKVPEFISDNKNG